jgi:putative heme iron utilization protein
VSLPVTATFIDRTAPDYEALATAYLERFPEAADWFALGDFSIVALDPGSARFIAGFARALTLSPQQVAGAVAGTAAG